MSTTIRVETYGFDEWRTALRLKEVAITRATRTATRQAATHLERAYKQTLRLRSHRRGTPTPSPPGEPPAKISGHLGRSVRSTRVRLVRRGVFESQIGPTAVYSRIQELGGITGNGYRTHLPARPYIKPTNRAQLAAVHEFYRRAWEEALRS